MFSIASRGNRSPSGIKISGCSAAYWIAAKFLLQGIVDGASIGFVTANCAEEHDTVIGIGGELGVFGIIWNGCWKW